MSRTYRRKNYKVNDFIAYTEEEFNYFKNNHFSKPEHFVKRPDWESDHSIFVARSVAMFSNETSSLVKKLNEYDEQMKRFLEFWYSEEMINWRRFCRFNNHVRNAKTYEEYIKFMKNMCHSDSWPTYRDTDSLYGRHRNRKLRRLHKNSIRKLSVDPDGDWVDVELVPYNKDLTITKFPNIHEIFE